MVQPSKLQVFQGDIGRRNVVAKARDTSLSRGVTHGQEAVRRANVTTSTCTQYTKAQWTWVRLVLSACQGVGAILRRSSGGEA